MFPKNWFKNAIIYHILIDRFAGFSSTTNWNKPEFLGGNIKGIIKKLPYLEDLGINTIWISPFYKTNTYHGYHIIDFFEVEPSFGTKEELKELIVTVHNKKMKIIADFVPNHCSHLHPYFFDSQKNKNSKYKDWFYFKNWPDKYLSFLSIKELPKINLENQEACTFMINAAKHWLSLGFDGFRLDHVIGPSHYFWMKFNNEIKKMFPNIVLIGEAWMKGILLHELKTLNIKNKYLKWVFGVSSDSLLKDYKKELDGVLDFKFQELIKKFVATGNLSVKDFNKKINNHFKKYPKNYFLPTFLDNHDMDRFLFSCKNDVGKLKQAVKIQFSIPQPIIIYYGTEIGMTQETSIWNIGKHGDIQTRQPMNWENQNKEIYSFYKNLIKTRKKREGLN
jgi:glycosidase